MCAGLPRWRFGPAATPVPAHVMCRVRCPSPVRSMRPRLTATATTPARVSGTSVKCRAPHHHPLWHPFSLSAPSSMWRRWAVLRAAVQERPGAQQRVQADQAGLPQAGQRQYFLHRLLRRRHVPALPRLHQRVGARRHGQVRSTWCNTLKAPSHRRTHADARCSARTLASAPGRTPATPPSPRARSSPSATPTPPRSACASQTVARADRCAAVRCAARGLLPSPARASSHADPPAGAASCTVGLAQVLPEGAPGVKPGGEVRRQEW